MSWFEKNIIFGKLFSSRNVQVDKTEVEEGDRFFQVGMGNSIWVVERICANTGSNIQHVVITRKGILPGSKIISSITLLDTEIYRRDRRGEETLSENDKKRRKTDKFS